MLAKTSTNGKTHKVIIKYLLGLEITVPQGTQGPNNILNYNVSLAPVVREDDGSFLVVLFTLL